MKIVKTLTSVVLLFLFTQLSFSQEFKVPTDIKLEQAEDYKNYESDILKCINWLENTPLNQDEQKRTNANAFLMLWITGAPNVSVTMQAFQIDLTEKNPALLINFIGG